MKRRPRWLERLISSAAVLVMSCSAAPASTQATLTLVATHHVGDAGVVDGSGLHLSTSKGDLVTLTRALVTLSSVEIFPCASATGRWLRWLSPVGSAWAHGVTTPRRLGVPNVVDLTTAEGQQLTLGQLVPPEGRYCQTRVTFGPIDADGAVASGFPQMQGYTMDLSGEVLVSGASSPVAFALKSQGVQGVALELPELPFKGGATVSLTLDLPVASWFDEADVTSDGGSAEVLARVATTTRVLP